LLPETHENSNYILLRIPIEIHLFERGLQGISMDPGRLLNLPGLSKQGTDSLCDAKVTFPCPQKAKPKERID